jgi:flotillin
VAVVIPSIHTYAWLSLEPVQVTIESEDLKPLHEGDISGIPLTYTIMIGTTPELLENAATRLLDCDVEQIRQHAKDLILSELQELLHREAEGQSVEAAILRQCFEERLQIFGLTLAGLHT